MISQNVWYMHIRNASLCSNHREWQISNFLYVSLKDNVSPIISHFNALILGAASLTLLSKSLHNTGQITTSFKYSIICRTYFDTFAWYSERLFTYHCLFGVSILRQNELYSWHYTNAVTFCTSEMRVMCIRIWHLTAYVTPSGSFQFHKLMLITNYDNTSFTVCVSSKCYLCRKILISQEISGAFKYTFYAVILFVFVFQPVNHNHLLSIGCGEL